MVIDYIIYNQCYDVLYQYWLMSSNIPSRIFLGVKLRVTYKYNNNNTSIQYVNGLKNPSVGNTYFLGCESLI